MNHRFFLALALAASALAVAGCKQDGGPAAAKQQIELPPGQMYISSQWAGNQLWVETFEPKASVCTFARYQDGKPVDETVTTFTNCKAVGAPMMRPPMPGRPGMNRPGAERRGQMQPGRPDAPAAAGADPRQNPPEPRQPVTPPPPAAADSN